MSLLRRGASLLGALRRAQAGPEALGAQLQRFGSEASTSEPHVAQDWYMRQRQQIILGNRMPVVTASSWVAPNATLIGDTDLMDRVRCCYRYALYIMIKLYYCALFCPSPGRVVVQYAYQSFFSAYLLDNAAL